MLTFVTRDPENVPAQVSGSAIIHGYRLLRTYYSLPASFTENKANEKIVALFKLLDGWMVTKAASEVLLNATEGQVHGQVQDVTMYSSVISGIVCCLEVVLSDVPEFISHYVEVVEENAPEATLQTPVTFN